MSYELYAYVHVPAHSTCPITHEPRHEHPLQHCRCILLSEHPTKQSAQLAAERTKHVWVDDNVLVPAGNIDYFEIIEKT